SAGTAGGSPGFEPPTPHPRALRIRSGGADVEAAAEYAKAEYHSVVLEDVSHWIPEEAHRRVRDKPQPRPHRRRTGRRGDRASDTSDHRRLRRAAPPPGRTARSADHSARHLQSAFGDDIPHDLGAAARDRVRAGVQELVLPPTVVHGIAVTFDQDARLA